ncbi:MAG: hypothetical protein ACJ75J_06205, partial [Cytophagaceae bacterium]
MRYIYRKCSFCISILYLTVITHALFAQDDSLRAITELDSVRVPYKLISRKDTLFSPNDTVIITRDLIIKDKTIPTTITLQHIRGTDTITTYIDTLIVTSDTIVARIDTIRTRNEKILLSVEQFSKKKNIFSRLLRNFMVFEKKQSVDNNASVSSQTEDKPYENFNGKVIRDIEIRVLDVFGRSIQDPGKKPKSLLEKGGNVIHIKSQRWIIRNKLLFRKGERLEPLKISESERLLRQANFIYDSRIQVRDLPGKDTVDIIVISQDVWSISGGAGYDQAHNSPAFSLEDVTFLGLGPQGGGALKLDCR